MRMRAGVPPRLCLLASAAAAHHLHGGGSSGPTQEVPLAVGHLAVARMLLQGIYQQARARRSPHERAAGPST